MRKFKNIFYSPILSIFKTLSNKSLNIAYNKAKEKIAR